MTGKIVIMLKEAGLFNGVKTIDVSRPEGISASVGILKSTNNQAIESYIFDSEKWTQETAEAWVKDNEVTAGVSIDRYGKLPIFKGLNFEIKEMSESDRSFWAVASTEVEDRQGDIVYADGWELKNFMKNPVILWAHQYDQLPVAKAEQIKIQDKKLLFKPKFATKEEYEFADTVFKLYRGGYLSAFSVGFDPKEWSNRMSKEGGYMGREYFKQELLEVSAVPVPANQEALQMRSVQDMIAKTYNFKPIEIQGKIQEPVAPVATPAPASAPVAPVQAPAQPVTLIEPVQFKNIQEMNELMTIWKTGRVLSEKNRETVQQCMDYMKQAIKSLKGLMDMTQPEEMEEEKAGNIDNSLNERFEKIIQESKSLLNRVNKKS